MSKRWGTNYAITEHRDVQANTMALDVTGTHVLLAGRRYLAVKRLDQESDSLKKFQRQSKYEVGSAEWNPTMANSHLCAISSNNRVEILSFMGNSGNDLQPTHNLKAHTRVVSDLNWHPKDPDILATCSIDTYIHIWDIRDQRKPSLSLSAVAGASQVRWNALAPNMIATAHDGDVKIWDQRKGNSPVQYIAAHLTKIYGLDWCPFQQSQLATSSQDSTVKFFDTSNPRRAESILTTNSPVWKARYTPFGEGLVTIVVPQLRRGENSLLLWNTSNLSTPIYTFVGHTDVVLEFQWRHPKSQNKDYELITWCKDQCLRIFKIPPLIMKLCGHGDINDAEYSQLTGDNDLRNYQSAQELELQDSTNEREINYAVKKPDHLTLNNDHETPVDPDVQSPTQPKTLQQEFSLINMNIPNIEVNAMDAADRSCTVTASNKNYNVVLKVNFPGNYPYSAQPTFQFRPGTTVDNAITTKLHKVLKQTAQHRVKKNRSCLEPCLRQLITTLDQMCVKNETEADHLGYHMQQNENFLNSNKMMFSACQDQDSCIPFPRTSGARFCGDGSLVCFGRSFSARRVSLKPEGTTTPRALSALGSSLKNRGPYISMYSNAYPQSNENISISSFYFQDRVPKRGTHGQSKLHGKSCYKNHRSLVTIYDMSSLSLVNRELAEKYIINTNDIPAMCQHNANVAASQERPDLVQAWCLASLVVSQTQKSQVTNSQQSLDDNIPWLLHPFGKNLIHSLIQHYAYQYDIQMAAMLCCTLTTKNESNNQLSNGHVSRSVNVTKQIAGRWWTKPGGSPYHTVHPADMKDFNYATLKQNRSNSMSDLSNGLQVPDTCSQASDAHSEHSRIVKKMDEKNTPLYNAYKKAYAGILWRWRLLDSRAQVLKQLSRIPYDVERERTVGFLSGCMNCQKASNGPQCLSCKRFILKCSICHISVRGSSNVCSQCGHGGHTNHVAAWFSKETVCPVGCGCFCVQNNMMYNPEDFED
ncbi:GATOR complex protein WDR59 isoform X1 [Trichogramma pretiosum]|uniref:GATOR complex protein WDR59 isoform X1 n=1 Tax=Trichogramma pretiosum TaxID=7493 RepID=UPI0006C96BE9|nr:GATOR complex protein WDR59 isoform X1 [Trichogramma pretiosum]